MGQPARCVHSPRRPGCCPARGLCAVQAIGASRACERRWEVGLKGSRQCPVPRRSGGCGCRGASCPEPWVEHQPPSAPTHPLRRKGRRISTRGGSARLPENPEAPSLAVPDVAPSLAGDGGAEARASSQPFFSCSVHGFPCPTSPIIKPPSWAKGNAALGAVLCTSCRF